MPKNNTVLAVFAVVSLMAFAAIYPGSVEAGPGIASEGSGGGAVILAAGIALTVAGWVGRKTR
jgi:hypothetical protein